MHNSGYILARFSGPFFDPSTKYDLYPPSKWKRGSRCIFTMETSLLKMLSEEEIKNLKKDNESLKKELDEINYLISIREEELEILRAKLSQVAELKSELDTNLDQISQMQLHLIDHQRKTEGALKREAALEDELLQSIEMEKAYYDIKEKFDSSLAAVKDMDNELGEAMDMYKQLGDANSKIAELESMMEIFKMENENLKLDIIDLKGQNKTG